MAGSAFVRRQLGKRMRKLREDAGRSQADVHAAGYASEITLWRLESGTGVPHWSKIKSLCEFYKADGRTIEALVELAKASKGTSWFEQYGAAVPQTLQTYLGAELAASRISTYDPEVIHGILQTEEYTCALFKGERPDSDPHAIQMLVDARRERQDMFWARRPEGAVLQAVLSEATLARQVGGRATMRRQLEHLSLLAGQEGVDVQVLVWDAGAHRAIYGGYAIFEFPDPLDPTVAYVENYTGGTYLDEGEDVRRMQSIHAGILELSTPLKEYSDG